MNLYGVKGFPTPDNVPEDSHCRTLIIPNSTAWLSVFMGALWALADERNWQKWGDMTPEEAAAAAQAVIWDAYNNNSCLAIDDAPFWNQPDGSDLNGDPEEGEGAPWYGVLVPVSSGFAVLSVDDPPEPEFTWQEKASIWIVTAFVAYAATPAAAVAFYALAKRFVIAFREHDLGGIVRVLIDGIESRTVDTYSASPGIKEVSIIVPPTPSGMGAAEDTHVLWIVLLDEANPAVTGTPEIQLVRKQLADSEVSPPNVRYDVACDCVQQTYDGGETWVDRPDIDPRSSTIYRYPHVTGSDPKCLAAGNMTDFVERWIVGVTNSLSLVQMANGILAIITLITPEVGFIIDLIWLVAEALISIGTTAISTAFTPDVYDDLLCSLYCVLDDDGQMSDAALTDFLTDIDTNYVLTVQLVIHEAANLWGAVGFSNAGTVGTSERVCDDCPCVDPCFIPSADTMAQAPCTSAVINYLRFDSEGAYSVVDAPFGQGAYVWLAGLKPSGIGIGWEVSFSWSGGSPTVFQAASAVRTTGACVDDAVDLSMTSGLTQSVDAAHPFVWVGWTGDGGVFHITEVCISRQS